MKAIKFALGSWLFIACADEASQDVEAKTIISRTEDDTTRSADAGLSAVHFGPIDEKLVAQPIYENVGGPIHNGDSAHTVAYSSVLGSRYLHITGVLNAGRADIPSGFAVVRLSQSGVALRATAGSIEYVRSGELGEIRLTGIVLEPVDGKGGASLGPIDGYVAGAVRSECPAEPAAFGLQYERTLADGGAEACPKSGP